MAMKAMPVRLAMVTVFLLIPTGFAVAAFPLGTCTATITRGDVPANFPPQLVALLIGRWEATFAAAGRQTATKDGAVVAEGLYATTQIQIAVL